MLMFAHAVASPRVSGIGCFWDIPVRPSALVTSPPRPTYWAGPSTGCGVRGGQSPSTDRIVDHLWATLAAYDGLRSALLKPSTPSLSIKSTSKSRQIAPHLPQSIRLIRHTIKSIDVRCRVAPRLTYPLPSLSLGDRCRQRILRRHLVLILGGILEIRRGDDSGGGRGLR